MSNKVVANRRKNVVEFDKLDIHPLANVGGMLYMVVGSDSEKAKDAFYNVVNRIAPVNFKGLTIGIGQGVMTGFNPDDESQAEVDYIRRKLDGITKNAYFWMPSGYDFEKRCAYIKDGEDKVKYYEALSTNFLKYCISRIGNPKHYLLFSINKQQYLRSDFYKNVIAVKHKG